MPDLMWALIVVAGAGGVGGFLARVVPGGVRKANVAGAPTEVGAFLSTLAGAAAGVVTLLMTDDYTQVVIIGKDADLTGVSLGTGDVVQAFTVGLIGLKWLVNHQDSQTLRKAVAEAATAPARADAAVAASASKPRDVLRAAQGN